MSLMIVCLILIASIFAEVNSNPCKSRDYGNNGTVCVCTVDYCDSIPELMTIEEPNYLVYTSNKAGLRFELQEGIFTLVNSNSTLPKITVDDSQHFQAINGWGGAFTDATGINLNSINSDLQEIVLRAYFSKEGLEYNLGRVPIGGTDFSARGYSYCDNVENEDKNLTNWALVDEDFAYKIPVIQKSVNINPNLQLFASAWTAPKWMKLNGNYSGMFGFLKSDMYQTWADYHIKFLDAYKEQGVEFWGLTTGNEPSLALFPAKINSVAWFPWQMQRYIAEHLGPSLRNSQHADIKLMAIDDQRVFLPWFADMIFSSEIARNYVDGIAVHWYLDSKYSPKLLTETHENYPEKFILATEACKGDIPEDPGVKLGSWSRAEDYAASIIEDINHWVTGWLDWNLLLDVRGGPTYIGNFVDAPIIINAKDGEFYKQPMYYAVGHFSKYVPRGSVRIYSNATGFDENVAVTAFKRPDNGVVLEILNKYDYPVSTVINDVRRGDIPIELSASSLTTIIYW